MADITDGNWHMVVRVVTPAGETVYVDGEESS